MKYTLDTDIIIYFLKGDPCVVQKIIEKPAEFLYTTIINQTELLYGAFNSTRKNENLAKLKSFFEKIQILPYCQKSSYIFAEQKALLKKQGILIADMDLMIASICLANQMTLVTNNKKHFERLKKLKIENWAKP